MRPKFIIVNNGMTGLRGHYFETGVSIAREAEKRFFETLMATHVTCDVTDLPADSRVYPLFRVDHWGTKVSPNAPSAYGLRGSASALLQTTIEDVVEGRLTTEHYLL